MVAKEELSELVRRVVSFIITLVILGIINAIVVRLPAMDIEVYDTITIANIASMIISVIIVAIVVIFGKDIAVRVEKIIPEFPELNPIIYNIVILAAIIIAYKAFEGLFIPLLDESNIMWIYPVVFLCAAILPIYRLTAVLFTSSGKIADVIVKEKKTTIVGTVICPACGTSVVKSKFCGACGQELPQPTVAANSCPKCGSALKPGARFCVYCGTEVSEPKAAPQHEYQVQPQLQSESQIDAEPQSRPEPQFQSVSQPQYESQTDPEPQPDPQPQSEPRPEPEFQSQHEFQSQPQSQSEPALELQPQPQERVTTQPLCPRCNTELMPGDEFCTNCGAKV